MFEVVVAEALDRVSRDQADVTTLYKHLSFAGVPVVTLAEGRSYGYEVVKAPDAAGERIRGERTINETQAEVVRRIFREYAAGMSPRAIARGLNAEGVPGPTGKRWSDSTVRGHADAGTGVLNNPAILIMAF